MGRASGSKGEGVAEGDQEQGTETRPKPRTIAEWTTLAVSLLITFALVGAALYEYVAQDEPAGTWITVRVAVDQAERREDRYYVPFTVANAGAEPAENVTLVFEVKRGEEVLEESTTDIAFLPNSGSEEGELVTAFDPAQHEITARVGTLQAP